MRTPAEHFFGTSLYKKLTAELMSWGQTNLGCAQISPVWLSYYVEGCEQKLHCDNGHGPWAFVWSISPKKPLFSGGQTKILRPEILDYWKNYEFGKGLEEDQIFDSIAPRNNRLIVFDPRLPHGVSRVSGVQDPREGRLVLHGWFTQPEPIASKGLNIKTTHGLLTQMITEEPELFAGSEQVTGTLCFHIKIATSGKVLQVERLTQNLMSRNGDQTFTKKFILKLEQRLKTWSFNKNSTPQRFLVLPLIFE
jgi:hypothetical protein